MCAIRNTISYDINIGHLMNSYSIVPSVPIIFSNHSIFWREREREGGGVTLFITSYV